MIVVVVAGADDQNLPIDWTKFVSYVVVVLAHPPETLSIRKQQRFDENNHNRPQKG